MILDLLQHACAAVKKKFLRSPGQGRLSAQNKMSYAQQVTRVNCEVSPVTPHINTVVEKNNKFSNILIPATCQDGITNKSRDIASTCSLAHYEGMDYSNNSYTHLEAIQEEPCGYLIAGSLAYIEHWSYDERLEHNAAEQDVAVRAECATPTDKTSVMCNAVHKSSAAKVAIEHVSGIVSDDSSPPVTPRSLLSGVPYTHERIDVKTGYADVMVAEQASLTSVDPRSFRSETDPTDVDNAAETPSTDIERSAFSVITIPLHLGTPPLQQGGSEEKIEESRNIEAPREISPAGLQFYRELFTHWASPRRPTDQPIAKKPDTMNTLATVSKLPTVKKSAVARKPGMKLKRRPQWGAVDNIPIYVDKARAWREFMAAVWNELADEYDLRGAAIQPIQGEAMEDEEPEVLKHDIAHNQEGMEDAATDDSSQAAADQPARGSERKPRPVTIQERLELTKTKQLACLEKYRMQQTKPCEDRYLSLMRQEAKLHVLGMMVAMRAIKKKQTQAA